ncbi:hypothetical protein [Helicobacter salomonis]|uniref:hypothetical protein n=1 Tax=Helicobacter salomonis TaxID=56878 RepID=UPI000CF0E001|nr:hypothetical protein [Helicobacter salomonis]
MRPVGNALELKLCKIPTIGTQSENQTLPTGNISLGGPNVFSIWALHSLLIRYLAKNVLYHTNDMFKILNVKNPANSWL